MKKKIIVIALVVLAVIALSSATYAFLGGPKKSPVEFYTGHSHNEDDHTIGAPQHSGGTDRYGCHNGSVPYHCH